MIEGGFEMSARKDLKNFSNQAQRPSEPVINSAAGRDGDRVHEIAVRTLIRHYIAKRYGRRNKVQFPGRAS